MSDTLMIFRLMDSKNEKKGSEVHEMNHVNKELSDEDMDLHQVE